MESYSVIIVDDDEQVCRILHDLFKREGYHVAIAHNGAEALQQISLSSPDLIISDIQMPVMDGFELFGILKNEYPHIKHVMMTSYDIDQYIQHIREFNIGNILVKGPDFNLSEVTTYIHSLLTGNIFGLDRYFHGVEYQQLCIQSYAEAKMAYHLMTDSFPVKKSFFLEIAIDELISNAIFHGVLQCSDLPRDQWSEDTRIPEESAVKLIWGYDKDKIGISIEDPKGNLKKNDVLKWLDNQYQMKDNNEHGRGFLLVRRLIDRLIINIDPGKRTECIIIHYFKRSAIVHNKPLLIHEL